MVSVLSLWLPILVSAVLVFLASSVTTCSSATTPATAALSRTRTA